MKVADSEFRSYFEEVKAVRLCTEIATCFDVLSHIQESNVIEHDHYTCNITNMLRAREHVLGSRGEQHCSTSAPASQCHDACLRTCIQCSWQHYYLVHMDLQKTATVSKDSDSLKRQSVKRNACYSKRLVSRSAPVRLPGCI